MTDDALYREVGIRLRQLRESVGMTQADLATRVGLERTSVTNIEAGKQKTPLHIIYRVASTLGVDLSRLLPTIEELRKSSGGVTVKVGRTTAEVPPKVAEVIRRVA